MVLIRGTRIYKGTGDFSLFLVFCYKMEISVFGILYNIIWSGNPDIIVKVRTSRLSLSPLRVFRVSPSTLTHEIPIELPETPHLSFPSPIDKETTRLRTLDVSL